jgi:hypothetical protein
MDSGNDLALAWRRDKHRRDYGSANCNGSLLHAFRQHGRQCACCLQYSVLRQLSW